MGGFILALRRTTANMEFITGVTCLMSGRRNILGHLQNTNSNTLKWCVMPASSLLPLLTVNCRSTAITNARSMLPIPSLSSPMAGTAMTKASSITDSPYPARNPHIHTGKAISLPRTHSNHLVSWGPANSHKSLQGD